MTKQELGKLKSPFEWCLDYNIRPYEPQWWNMMGEEDRMWNSSFHTSVCTEEEFLEELKCHKHKENSRPRKMDEFLEMRMYGLVIYQLMGIQQGIQFQHAVTDYGREMEQLSTFNNEGNTNLQNRYQRWADKWKTSIVLNGGSTNDSSDYVGTMQQHLKSLRENGIYVQEFREPDLGDCLTAMCFLIDERVFDREAYPDFTNSPYTWDSRHKPNEATFKKWEEDNAKNYERWVEKIGGPKNAFLREFLPKFKLA